MGVRRAVVSFLSIWLLPLPTWPFPSTSPPTPRHPSDHHTHVPYHSEAATPLLYLEENTPPPSHPHENNTNIIHESCIVALTTHVFWLIWRVVKHENCKNADIELFFFFPSINLELLLLSLRCIEVIKYNSFTFSRSTDKFTVYCFRSRNYYIHYTVYGIIYGVCKVTRF